MNELLSKEYAAERRRLIDPSRATVNQVHGSPVAGSDTVYLSAADSEGTGALDLFTRFQAELRERWQASGLTKRWSN